MGRVDLAPALRRHLEGLEGHRQAGRPGAPLVTRVLNRTVEKVDSIGIVVRRWMWCSVEES
jgi:hypothetical protein